MPPAQQQTALPFGSPVATEPAAAAAPAEDRATKAARGSLTHGRQDEISRMEKGLTNLVHNWDNRAIVTASTIAKMKYSQRDLITENMKPITDVLKKTQHLATVKGQFRGYFESAASEPVRCYEKHGEAIATLMKQSVGDMTPKELKVKINESSLGKLNKYLGMLRTFVAEEMDEKIRCDGTACGLFSFRAVQHACVCESTVLLL